MNDETYYRDHWVEIEPERMETYEQILQWRPEMEALLAPAAISAGQVVVDYGCGPGALSVELAGRVGSTGTVHALDINAEFIQRTLARAEREGVAKQLSVHLLDGDRIPLESDSVDRIVCKNVLEYVPDPNAVLREFRRVLRPGGLAHVIDSDWGLLIVEPIGPERTRELMAAASVAFRTPHIGRELYGDFRRAGFSEVRVAVRANVDTAGTLQFVLNNMATYARASGRIEAAELDRYLSDVRKAVEAGTYLAMLPQFVVTATA